MIIDTMIFVYALLGVTEYRTQAAQVLARADEIWAPDFLRAVLVNVVWQWIQFKGIAMETGAAVLTEAEALITGFVSTERLSGRALELSVAARHPAYDTLFIALAERMETRVVSYDERLKAKFPQFVLTPREFIDEE